MGHDLIANHPCLVGIRPPFRAHSTTTRAASTRAKLRCRNTFGTSEAPTNQSWCTAASGTNATLASQHTSIASATADVAPDPTRALLEVAIPPILGRKPIPCNPTPDRLCVRAPIPRSTRTRQLPLAIEAPPQISLRAEHDRPATPNHSQDFCPRRNPCAPHEP
jgi:hypothetical protein